MLNKTQIKEGRNDMAKIESRHIHLFMRRQIGKEAVDHIYAKVAESITGTTNERYFGFNEAYDWQISNEPAAIKMYGNSISVGKIVSDITIKNKYNPLFCTIPTGLHLKIVNQKNPDEYVAEPIVCKCPYDQDQFVRFRMLKSAEEVKQHFPKYYWRVLDQMDNASSVTAQLVIYHPLFPDGEQYHVIEFEKALVWRDLHFLQSRKLQATDIFNNTLRKMQQKA
jgi:hypothetical protein